LLYGKHCIIYFQLFLRISLTYTADNRVLGFSPNFSGIRGNGSEGGILLNQATPNLPWTIEEQRDIEWQRQVINSRNRALHISAWLSMGSNPAPLDVSAILMEAPDNISAEPCTINVRFRDTLGYVSDREMGEMGKIKYGVQSVKGSPANNWSVSYSDPGTLNISWETPGDMSGVKVMLYDEVSDDWDELADRTELSTYTNFVDFDPPTGRGTATEYLFNLIAYSGTTADAPLDEPIKIWNYPGMVNSEANRIIEIADENDLAAIITSGLGDANKNKHYILTDNITLSSAWTPIGNASGTFRGKFYGNGKKITVSGGFKSGNQYNGIFGIIENALIRDIEVLYSSDVSSGYSGTYYLGGIAGIVDGDSSLIDCEVSGGTLDGYSTGRSAFVGGIAGRLLGNSQVINCIGIINISAKGSGASNNNPVYAGGIAGSTSDNSNNKVSIQNSGYTGSLISATHFNANASVYAGGLLGAASYVTIEKCYSTGEVKAENRGDYLYAGGLAGALSNVTLEQSRASGNVTATRTSTYNGSHDISAGGLIAYDNGSDIKNCYSRGNVKVDVNYTNDGAGKYAGGLIGYSTSSTQIKFGFSTGSVENKYSGGGGYMYAGGIVGNIGIYAKIENFVVLGGPITAQKDSGNYNPRAYRIGDRVDNSSSFTNNYALNTIKVGTHNGPNAYNVTVTTNTVPDGTASNENGEDVDDATRRTAGFWVGTMGFDMAWNATGVVVSTMGHPILQGFPAGVQGE